MTLIADRYQPLEPARPGVPQRARDLQTAQSVVLRTVTRPDENADELLARARAATGIFHPSLVTLFDVIPQSDHVLLAYEYVPAQTLAHVTSGHPFHPKRAAEILAELGDAVAELHARGITHGGITQPNVLLTMKGKAKLDRVGDPSASRRVLDISPEGDLESLGNLLRELVGKPRPGVAGMQGIDAIIDRACSGQESAATFAALLRRLSA